MATLADPPQDFTRLPEMPGHVFTAPLKRPVHVGEDWLEPKQTEYDSEDDAIWDDLFARQMEVLPGRAATAFLRVWRSSIWAAAAFPTSARCRRIWKS